MKKILFCGGGSAGHVVPNIALIEELHGYECVYIGTDGIERDICAENGVEFHLCPAPKLVRGKILCNLSIPFRLFKAVKEAGAIMDEIKPDLVFSKGGYACVPAVLAAHKRHIDIITHESDLNPGLATRFISKKCRKVLTSFPSAAAMFPNGVYTGSPIRRNLFSCSKAKALETFGLDFRPTVIVLGGGSGSRAINEAVRKAVPALCKQYNVLHVCGKGNLADSNIYGYKQIEFTGEMGAVYACADAAVSRCGSNTAFELTALKIPALYIPLENSASRGDQIKNAEYFAGIGVAEVLREKLMNEETLRLGITEVLNSAKIKDALSKCAIKSGNDRIRTEVERTIRQRS